MKEHIEPIIMTAELEDCLALSVKHHFYALWPLSVEKPALYARLLDAIKPDEKHDYENYKNWQFILKHCTDQRAIREHKVAQYGELIEDMLCDWAGDAMEDYSDHTVQDWGECFSEVLEYGNKHG